jgi:subtilisin family serine protease
VVVLVAIAAALVPYQSPLDRTVSSVAAQDEPGEAAVIVVLRPRVDPAAVARAAGIRPERLYRNVFNGFSGRVPAQALQGLRRNPNVELVSLDLPVGIAATTLPTGIDRADADQHPWAGISGAGGRVDADVAVLDTGIAAHPDLDIAGGEGCAGTGGYGDGAGHGTHVAGTIGALDDGQGVVGAAPGVRLWAVKVLGDNGSGSWSSVICGLDWVYANQETIEVVNMSLGGSGSDGSCGDDALHRAICNVVGAGVPVVVAAGNDGQNAGGQGARDVRRSHHGLRLCRFRWQAGRWCRGDVLVRR